MTAEFNVLVSSAGRRVALVEIFRRTLKDMGLPGRVFATDMSRSSAAFHAADAAFLVPHATDPTFIPALIDLCREERIRLIVPTIDTEQRTLARARERFAEAGITVAVSSPDVVEIAADKWRTHEWLTGAGLPTVRQASVDEVLSNLSEWQFPLIVKPRFGTAGIGVSLAWDAPHLEILARGIPAAVGRQIEEGKLTEEDGPGEAVVQTVAPGREHTVDILADRTGQCVCAVTRVRLEVRSGESSKGVTVRVPGLEDLARSAVQALPGPFGPLTMQSFVDGVSGAIEIIEINPRFGGGYPLAWQAGAHYPEWLINEVLGEPPPSEAQWQEGVVMLRYDEAVFVHTGDIGS